MKKHSKHHEKLWVGENAESTRRIFQIQIGYDKTVKTVRKNQWDKKKY